MSEYSKQSRARFGVFVTAVIAVALGGCGREPDAAAGQASPEKAVYRQHCATCHGFDGVGRPPAFPPLAGSEWLALGDRAIALIVLYGLQGEIRVDGRRYRGFMPAMSHLDDDDILAAVGHVSRTWSEREPGLDAAELERMREIFGPRRAPWQGRRALEDALEQLEQP